MHLLDASCRAIYGIFMDGPINFVVSRDWIMVYSNGSPDTRKFYERQNISTQVSLISPYILCVVLVKNNWKAAGCLEGYCTGHW